MNLFLRYVLSRGPINHGLGGARSSNANGRVQCAAFLSANPHIAGICVDSE